MKTKIQNCIKIITVIMIIMIRIQILQEIKFKIFEYITGLVCYMHFLKKVDHADELGRLDKVECSLARHFFLLGSSLIHKLVNELGHA
jgi:hypothetical protein